MKLVILKTSSNCHWFSWFGKEDRTSCGVKGGERRGIKVVICSYQTINGLIKAAICDNMQIILFISQ